MADIFTRKRSDNLVSAVVEAMNGSHVLYALPNMWMAREFFELAIETKSLMISSVQVDKDDLAILYETNGGMVFGTKTSQGVFDLTVDSDE